MTKMNDGSVAFPIDFGDSLPPAEPIVDPEKKDQLPDPEPEPPAPEPEKTKRGRVKKDTVITDPDPDPEPTPDPNEPPVEEPYINTLATKWGIEFEEGEEYEDSEEGLEEFINAVAERRAESNFQSFMEQYPEAAEYFDFIALGGKKEDFFKASNPEINYKTIDLKNSDVQKSIMRTWYRKNDFTTEEAEEAINDLEVSGILDKQATLASNKLASLQEKEKATLIQAQQAKAQEQNAKIAQYWGEVDKTVKAGKVKNFVIPEKDRKTLYEYMAKPVAPGKSQEMLEDEKMDYETRVALAFLKMKKFDLNSLIQKAASTQRATTLSEKLKEASKMKSGDSRSDGGMVIPDIDLKHLTRQ